jgi:hypothetical protein
MDGVNRARASLRAQHKPWNKLACVVPLVIYAAISLIYFGGFQSWTHEYMGTGPDPITYVWFIHWWPFAIQHHLNPFVTDYVWHPHAINLAWTTSIPLVALTLWPVTATAGPILAYNIATVMAPALSAWTAFLLAHYLSRRWLPSLLAGYLFGFSSYELGQMMGHLNLVLVFLVPLAVLLCIARLRNDLSRRMFIPALALVLTAQMGISTEILASLCLLGAAAWWIFLVFAQTHERERFWWLAKDIALTAPLTMLFAAPFLYYLWHGIAHGQPFHTSPTEYSADPLNYVVPTSVNLVGAHLQSETAKHFTGELAEQGAYLGLPLIAMMVWYFRDHYRTAVGKALLITVIAIAVLSLGPRLHIANHVTPVRLPWHLFIKIPAIAQALPTRFTLYVALCASMIAALWMADAKTVRQSIARIALALLAVVALLPNRTTFPWVPWPVHAFFQAPHLQGVPGKLPNVLILPFSDRGAGMAWQVDAGMSFTQAAGYLGPDPRDEDASFLKQLRESEPTPGFAQDLTAYCLAHEVDYIVVGPGTADSVAKKIDELSWEKYLDRSILVVIPPGRTSAK